MAKVNLDNFKYEIANELGVKTGAETTSRDNGRVGGQMVKRLIEQAERQLHTR